MTIRVLLKDLAPGQTYAAQFRSYNGDGYSDWSQIMRFDTTADTIAPGAITGLVWNVVGGTFTASWDHLVLDANGAYMSDFRDYVVTISDGDPNTAQTYYVTSEKFTFGLDQNKNAFGVIQPTLTITVAGRDHTGNLGTSATATATDPLPPIPTKPTVSVYLGQLVVEWNGMGANGFSMPYNFDSVEIHVSTTNGFTPSDATLNQKIYSAAKVIVSNLTYGTTYYVKLIAVNSLGRKSDPSAQDSGTPVRISGLDIQNNAISVDQINFSDKLGGGKAWYGTAFPTTGMGEGDTFFNTADGYHPYVYHSGQWMDVRDATIASAQSAATTALTSANGKNKVTYSTSAASGNGTTAGDIWFQKDANGVIIGQWEWSGTAWISHTVSGTIVASGIDAGNITAGLLNAGRIAANTITADKLTVSVASGDLLTNGSFTDVDATNMPLLWTTDNGTGYTGATYSTTTVAANVGSGTRSLVINNAANNAARAYTTRTLALGAGDKVTISAWIKGAAAYAETTAVALNVLCYDSSGALINTVTAWTGAVTASFVNYSGLATLPANTVTAQVAVVLSSNAAARTIYVSTVTARRSVGATMIADGAITTTKIQAGAITSDLVGTNQIIASKANIGLAVIDSTNIGSVNAGTITTGQMQSGMTVSVGGTNRPAWIIDTAGNATFSNANIWGTVTVGNNADTAAAKTATSLQSANYLPGTAGWAIKGDGTVEFSSGTFRGTLASGVSITSPVITGGKIDGTTITGVDISASSTIRGATITGGTFQTSQSTISSVVIDTTGIKLWNSSGQNSVNLSTSGSALVTGIYRSNFSGMRVEIDGTWTRANAANPNAPYSGMRMYGSDGTWGEIGTGGDPQISGVTTLQMISPGATGVGGGNGSFLRLRSDNSYTLFSNTTGNVSSYGSLTVASTASSVSISGTLINLNATAYASTVYLNTVYARGSSLTFSGTPIYLYGGAGYIAVTASSGTPFLSFGGGGQSGALKFASFGANGADPGGPGLSVLNSSDTGYYIVRASGYAAISDVSVKSNITRSQSLLAQVVNTPVYEYDMDSGGDGRKSSRKRGLLAHEAPSQIVVPGSRDANAKTHEKLSSIDLYGMTATAWGAIKELYDTIEGLKNEISTLKGTK